MTVAGEPILEARDLRHAYQSDGVTTPVLHGVDLELRRGEFVMLMGPSGCGKTTLLHILGLMMRPGGGALRIAGADAGEMSESARARFRREHIGFVFQRFNLLPILTARDNVALPLRLRRVHTDGHAADALRQVGLAEKADRKPRALSIGEQQRVALARAIVTRPDILLADEPTGNLDSGNARIVLDLLLELHRAIGLTTLMITHNEHLAACADRVLYMRDGRLSGTPT